MSLKTVANCAAVLSAIGAVVAILGVVHIFNDMRDFEENAVEQLDDFQV